MVNFLNKVNIVRVTPFLMAMYGHIPSIQCVACVLTFQLLHFTSYNRLTTDYPVMEPYHLTLVIEFCYYMSKYEIYISTIEKNVYD